MAGFSLQTTGNAFGVLSNAARTARQHLMAAANRAAHIMQARAKINVHQKLNTTGLSKGTLSRSITVLSHPSRLEAEIGPSVVYGRIHELEGTIRPVRGAYLWFRVPVAQAISYTKEGKVKAGKMEMSGLIRVKEVTLPPRPYLQPALDDSESDIKSIFEHETQALFREAPALLAGGRASGSSGFAAHGGED